MKEWCLKHPILTFFLAGSLIDGIVAIVQAVSNAVSGDSEEAVKEEPEETTEEEETT